MSSDGERGRDDLLGLIADIRERLTAVEAYVQSLPADSVDLRVVRTIWRPEGGWHWNGEEAGTIEKFVEMLVQDSAVDPPTVIEAYLHAWHQSTRYDSDEILDRGDE